MSMVHSDFHLHTYPSSRCAKEEGTVENYLKLALEQGITVMGISNHFWDDDVRHQNEDQWFYDHSWDNLYKLLPDIPKDMKGVKLYLGAEVDVDKDLVLGLAKKNASRLDYVLIATNHFHAKGFEIYDDVDLNDVNVIKKIQIEHFLTAVRSDLGVFTIIAHPFIIHGVPKEKQVEFIHSMSDEDFRFCFNEAAKHNVAIELHIGHLGAPGFVKDENGVCPEYVNMFKIAKECGCKFTYGSDAHWLSMFTHEGIDKLIEAVGITEDDLVQELPTCHLI